MRTTETAHVGPPRASTTAAHVTRRRVMGGLGALAALPAMLTGTQGAAATVAGSIRPARSQRTTSDGLDRSKLRFIDVHGIRTRYHEDGSGEALVLVHGGQFGDFNSLDCWSLNLPVLA